uniref:Uncharacterized protein n=1 Tax=viral metagenome TaxID=1070528 RepID=A0A6C0I3M0_9ZZZZ
MNYTINHISHIGDIFAIPFFTLLVYYFYMIENKSPFEMILFLFSVSGLLLDTSFSFFYLFTK